MLTVGHSNLTADAFLELLTGAGLQQVIDVRRFPGSRRNPHFASDSLARMLTDAGFTYVHIPELGGRRIPVAESRNDAWKVEAFRGYADHLRSPEFAEGRSRTADLALQRRSTLLCADALPWRCHRRLIADVFVFDGWQVDDLMLDGRQVAHVPPPFAILGRDGLPLYTNPRTGPFCGHPRSQDPHPADRLAAAPRQETKT